MTDENAVDPEAPDEVQVAADQEAAEAAEWTPEPVEAGTMGDVEAARSGIPAQATDAAPVEPSAPSEAPSGLSARMDALEARLAGLGDEVRAAVAAVVDSLQERLAALEAKLP